MLSRREVHINNNPNNLHLILPSHIKMSPSNFPNFYAFSKVNPSTKDCDTFIQSCKQLNARCFGYDIKQRNTRQYFQGFIVLHTTPNNIESDFPNFLLSKVLFKPPK